MSDILKIFGTVMKSLFKKPACDRYPFQKPTVYERTRGHVVIDAPRCILCSLCARQCPTHAIQVDREKRTWKIDHLRCILCNHCVEVCPPKCLSMPAQYAAPSTEKNLECFDIPEKAK